MARVEVHGVWSLPWHPSATSYEIVHWHVVAYTHWLPRVPWAGYVGALLWRGKIGYNPDRRMTAEQLEEFLAKQVQQD